MTDKPVLGPAHYSPVELIVFAEFLFGVKPEVVAGALYGKAETKFTLAGMQTEINSFLKTAGSAGHG
jgi:hypothetical protein